MSDGLITDLNQFVHALKSKDYQTAAALQLELAQNRPDEVTNWLPALKRIIDMSRAIV